MAINLYRNIAIKSKEMGATKAEGFTKRQQQIAAIMKAMAHPARVAIIDYLLSVSNCICGDIVGSLPLAQATVSQHLKELKTAGLIKGNIEGNSVCYCLNEVVFTQFQTYLSGFFTQFEKQKNNCCST